MEELLSQPKPKWYEIPLAISGLYVMIDLLTFGSIAQFIVGWLL